MKKFLKAFLLIGIGFALPWFFHSTTTHAESHVVAQQDVTFEPSPTCHFVQTNIWYGNFDKSKPLNIAITNTSDRGETIRVESVGQYVVPIEEKGSYWVNEMTDLVNEYSYLGGDLVAPGNTIRTASITIPSHPNLSLLEVGITWSVHASSERSAKATIVVTQD